MIAATLAGSDHFMTPSQLIIRRMVRRARRFGLDVSAFFLLPSALLLAGCAPKAVAPPPPNILLITIDTLRADRVGNGLTPALDALAKDGVTFTEARSVVPLTLP